MVTYICHEIVFKELYFGHILTPTIFVKSAASVFLADRCSVCGTCTTNYQKVKFQKPNFHRHHREFLKWIMFGNKLMFVSLCIS